MSKRRLPPPASSGAHDSLRDTIAAIATAAGAAGIGIVRLSGPLARAICVELCGGVSLRPRHAHHVRFLDADGAPIDDGIALWFRAPHSYTGEDVVELQAHGSPPLLARLLARCLARGARAARPGEFTERAFLEGKLDLAQAEAVADLIGAGSDAAARAARRSLDGEFSQRVHALVEELTVLRVHVEAGFDFPDEDIDALATPALQARLSSVLQSLRGLRAAAANGLRLVDGLHAVIVGAPNVGKSSLLNALAADERAIVSAVAGTTRDVLREQLRLDGVELTLVDTAGLRDSPDAIEAAHAPSLAAPTWCWSCWMRASPTRRRRRCPNWRRARRCCACTTRATHSTPRRCSASATSPRAATSMPATRCGFPRVPGWDSMRCAPGCGRWRAAMWRARVPAAGARVASARARATSRRSTARCRCCSSPASNCVPARPSSPPTNCAARRRRWATSPRRSTPTRCSAASSPASALASSGVVPAESAAGTMWIVVRARSWRSHRPADTRGAFPARGPAD
jgi:hypothetical protein